MPFVDKSTLTYRATNSFPIRKWLDPARNPTTGDVQISGTSAVNTGTNLGTGVAYGVYLTAATTVNAFKLLNLAGNLTTGNFALYGIKQA